ncbi:two component transcriptional regulator, LytTR family [Fibrisoma limi BUZ 3]|uniref:Two component transcriptional regulator, LytTR family n=1 Tax=Fibrisoma limi BUZ 3 TaxID=1185876 RepID=I2GML4_9BACT|nr:LytTR family DNA-binding domain-containing protein [Fibrisoma limi]CCH55142.1 two component transcriptional regulator, LytTR family [Fibrisoma limi BUZ 3]
MILKCIIVDDELMARKSLQRLCEQHESLELLAVCENATEALKVLAEQEVDLIWLDVEMPGLSGFELLERLPATPQVVLTTTKTEYAFDAFQYQVADYLKKPIAIPRFKLAVEKVLELSNRSKTIQATANHRKDIYVKTDGRYIRIPYETISYIENMGDYVKIITNQQTFVVYTTMKSLEEKLGREFLRVHRSYIVHLDKIVDIEENNLVIANKVVPISRANKAELMNRLNLL